MAETVRRPHASRSRTQCYKRKGRGIARYTFVHGPWPQEERMLKWAIIFAIISLVTGVLGFRGISGAAATIAKFLFAIFLILFLIAVLAVIGILHIV